MEHDGCRRRKSGISAFRSTLADNHLHSNQPEIKRPRLRSAGKGGFLAAFG